MRGWGAGKEKGELAGHRGRGGNKGLQQGETHFSYLVSHSMPGARHVVLAGHIDTDNESYVMHWPGLLAVFQATPAQAASWQAMQQGRADAAAISSGVAPAAVRLCIFAGSAGMPT